MKIEELRAHEAEVRAKIRELMEEICDSPHPAGTRGPSVEILRAKHALWGDVNRGLREARKALETLEAMTSP